MVIAWLRAHALLAVQLTFLSFPAPGTREPGGGRALSTPLVRAPRGDEDRAPPSLRAAPSPRRHSPGRGPAHSQHLPGLPRAAASGQTVRQGSGRRALPSAPSPPVPFLSPPPLPSLSSHTPDVPPVALPMPHGPSCGLRAPLPTHPHAFPLSPWPPGTRGLRWRQGRVCAAVGPLWPVGGGVCLLLSSGLTDWSFEPGL